MEWFDCFVIVLVCVGVGCLLFFGILVGVLGLIEGLGSR